MAVRSLFLPVVSLCRPAHLIVSRVKLSVTDIVGNRTGKQMRILKHIAKR